MKKYKVPIIICLIVIILFFVNLRFDLIDRIIVQFSSEKYSEFVSEMDYEEALLKEPVCIKDMASEDRELTETELDKIIFSSLSTSSIFQTKTNSPRISLLLPNCSGFVSIFLSKAIYSPPLL